jgi:predicted nuclease of restriction endonuclease-like RecB superfamily
VFADKWGLEKRDGWELIREGEVLCRGQKVFVPDFVFRHDDGRTVLMEIVGFWTPEYLAAKIETLRAFPDNRILLATGGAATDTLADLHGDVLPFKSALQIKAVLARLESFAV